MESWYLRVRVAALSVLLVATVGCGDGRSDAQKLQDALANVEQGNYRAASIDLKNILREQPDDIAARLALGQVALRLGDAGAAEKEFSRARDLGANTDDYAVPLAQAMSQNQAFREVLAELDPAAIRDSATADTLRGYRALALFEIGSFDDADAALDSLIARQPSGEGMRLALIGKARLAARSGDLPVAEELVRQSLDFVPDSVDSTLLLGRILLDQKDAEQAERVFTYGRDELRGTVMERFLLGAGLVEALLAQDKAVQARALATDLVNSGVQHPLARYSLARALLKSGEPQAAAETLRTLVGRYPGFVDGKVLLGAVALQLGDFEQAEMVLLPVLSDQPDNVMARRLLAEVRLRLNRPDEASDTLLDQDGGAVDPRSLNMLARAELSRGNQQSAIRLLEETLARDADNVEAKLALISAYHADGQLDRAIAMIEALPETQIPQPRREAMLLMAGIDRDRIAESVARIDTMVERADDDIAVLSIAAGLYTAGGLNDKARALYERLHRMVPDNVNVIANIARLDSRRGNFDRSRALFEDHLSRHPDDVTALLSMAQIADAEGDAAAATRYAQLVRTANPDALAPHLMLATDALENGDLQAAQGYAEAALKNAPESAPAHAIMGMTQNLSGNIEAALDSFRQAAALQPSVALYHYYKGVTEMQRGLTRSARASLAQVVELDGNNFRARGTLMMLDAKAGDMQQAEAQLQALQQQRPDHAATLEAEGDLRAEQNRHAEAATAYGMALALNPTRRLAQRHFEMLKAAGQPRPLTPLEAWLTTHPDDSSVRLMYAQELHVSGAAAAAIEQYEKVLSVTPDNAVAMNNLAWLYLEQSSSAASDRALELAQQAYTAQPGNAQIADTYGWILFKTGDPNQARNVLQRALERENPVSQPDIAYHLAAVLADAGELNEARRLLNGALGSDQPFQSRADARTLLNAL